MHRSLLVYAVLLAAMAGNVPAQPADATLRYVVVLSRHGVRAPTAALEDLHRYSSDAWPGFGVAPGELTVHGRKLMTLLGSWYRGWLEPGAFLPPGCEAMRLAHIRADVDHRTFDSARAFADGFAPGCAVNIEKAKEDTDPLFHPAAAGLVHGDGKRAAAAVSGRIGGNVNALTEAYAPAFETLHRILFGCEPDVPCAAAAQPGKQTLLTMPASITPSEEGLADIRGPIRTGSTLSENLLLEYSNGMTGKALGWGRLNSKNLNAVMAIHTAYADLARRTPYLARLQGSNLLQHILLSMDQARSGVAVPGALGKPSDRLLYLGAHDTNITHIASLLNLSWLLPGYQRDDSPPGGALVFRLWKRGAAYSIDLVFVAQTLEQMHTGANLTAASPPAVAPVFVPGCSEPGLRHECTWEAFRAGAASAIDPGAVSQEEKKKGPDR